MGFEGNGGCCGPHVDVDHAKGNYKTYEYNFGSSGNSETKITEVSEKSKDVTNRIFMAPAELRIIEKGNAPTYGLYRDLVKESPEGKREKLRSLGPLGIFRKVEDTERPALRTIDPESGKELLLFCISQGSL